MVDIRLIEESETVRQHRRAGRVRRVSHGNGERRAGAVVIRRAGTTDVSLLAGMLRESFRDVAERFGLTVENCPKSVAFHTEERVEADFERGMQYYILEERGVARGCVALEQPRPELCYLGRLAVLPECRGRGFGKALATRVFYEAWALGTRRVEIGMIAENSKLAEWYGRLGFVHNGRKRFDHLPFEVGFMVKKL